jgi:dynein heavy chain
MEVSLTTLFPVLSIHSGQVSNYLKDTWAVTLKNAIKSSFKDVGKGWFNLHESNMET